MHVRTNRYGETIIHDAPVAQASLASRVRKELKAQGRYTPSLLVEAEDLIRTYPSLSTTQACAYVIHKAHVTQA